MKVAAIQHDIVWEDPAANFAHLAPMIEQAAADGARLAVLTEMFATGFSMATERIAEPVDGPSTAFLVEQAAAHGLWVCGSVPERAPGDDRPSNCLVLAGPDGSVHRYRKIHPFSYSGEHEHYAAGHEHLTVDRRRRAVQFLRVLRPALRRRVLGPRRRHRLLRRGGELAGGAARPLAHLVAGAGDREPGLRGGREPGRLPGGGLEYAGDSAIIWPFGNPVVEAAENEEVELLFAEVDPTVVASTRQQYPFLVDRR